MKGKVKSFSVSIVTSLLLVFVGCKSSEQKAREAKIAQQEALNHRNDSEVRKLASSMGALTDWQGPLKNATYTAQVQPLFVTPSHRATMFYADLEDIRPSAAGEDLIFRTTTTQTEPTLRLRLRCEGCDLSYLQSFSKSAGDFAVIGQIDEVSKVLDGPDDAPDYELTGKYLVSRYVGDLAFNQALALRNKSSD